MRIMLDTNTLITLIISDSKPVWDIINSLASGNTVVLSTFVIDELHTIIQSKFPSKAGKVKQFLLHLPFKYAHTPKKIEEDLYGLKDFHNYPILYTAIREGVDILISRDKEFQEIEELENLQIFSPSEYLKKCCRQQPL